MDHVVIAVCVLGPDLEEEFHSRSSPGAEEYRCFATVQTIERSKSRSVAHYGRVVIDDCLGDRRHLAALGILATEWFAWQPVHQTVPG